MPRIISILLVLLAGLLQTCSSLPKGKTEQAQEDSKQGKEAPVPDAGALAETAVSSKPAKASKKPVAKDGKTTTESEPAAPSNVTQSGLKAGYADDNKQYNYFVKFLQKYKSEARHLPLDVSERIRLEVLDNAKKPVANAAITLVGDGKNLSVGKTYADGSFYFFPSEFPGIDKFEVAVSHQQAKERVQIERSGKRNHSLTLPAPRTAPAQVPVDIVFVFDTTASMGEEIARLKNTIELIEMNISALVPKPKLRFGMVLYKDKEDEYVTRVVPLTENLAKFRKELDKVEASGGGDIPENLQDALKDTIRLDWNTDGVRLAFIITDAPPHLDYGQDYTYVNAMKDAKARGIKFFSIGTGGLDIHGEYILRQIAQYTYGKYIFLTYGEKGESAGGTAGSVSHHTGEQFSADKLESIIIRFTKEEISYQSDTPLEKGNEYFVASKISSEVREKTLRALFDKSLAQLVDYSSLKIKEGSTIAIMPIQTSNKADAASAEYFGEQVLLSSKQNKNFKVVERKNLQKILKELELQQSGATSTTGSAKMGELVGADLLLIGQIYRKDEYEIYLKLVRVETGEVLAVTKARIDLKLGLGK